VLFLDHQEYYAMITGLNALLRMQMELVLNITHSSLLNFISMMIIMHTGKNKELLL
jgi:hypothetical protein